MLLRIGLLISVILSTLSCWPTLCLASPTNEMLLASSGVKIPLLRQRGLYQVAIESVERGNIKKFKSLRENLEGYPLALYADYEFLKKTLKNQPDHSLMDYLQSWPDTPPENWLRKRILKQKVASKDWKGYLNFYVHNKDSELRCNYLNALWKSNKITRGYGAAKSIWLTHKSLPSSCDDVMAYLVKKKIINRNDIWKRKGLALLHRKTRLYSWLDKYLSKADRKRSETWKALYKKPKKLNNTKRLKALLEATPQSNTLLTSVYKQWVRTDPDEAVGFWSKLRAHIDFTPDEMATLTKTIARQLIIHRHPDLQGWVAASYIWSSEPELIDFALQDSLRHERWDQILFWTTVIPESMQAEDKWLYWRARALQEFKREKNTAPAASRDIFDHTYPPLRRYTSDAFKQRMSNWESWNFYLTGMSFAKPTKWTLATPKELLRRVAKQRGFYGFVAAQRLDRPPSMNHSSISVSDDDQHWLNSLPQVHRAKEFYILEQPHLARLEWHYLLKWLNEGERQTATKVAALWGWHTQAIFAAAKSDIARDDLSARFPRPYSDLVVSHAKRNELDEFWIYALMRQESAFIPDARSPVGAMGLMQLMPATAKRVAKRNRIPYSKSRELLKPATNIQLGTAYMKQLIKQFDGNMVLATAAYNAGPTRARQWQPKNRAIPGDIWVETIPFKETREYVKNVMTYHAIYQHQTGLRAQLAQSLAMIEPRD